MKKIVIASMLAFAAFLGGHQLYKGQTISSLSEIMKANVEALALDWNHINPDCPNGCVASLRPEGCFCYQYYPQYNEYVWIDGD